MTATTKQPTGTLNYKRVAAYFKKTGMDVHVQRFEEEFIISNSYNMVKIPSHPDLFYYISFSPTWERAIVPNGQAEEGGQGAVAVWQRLENREHVTRLEVTHDLKEIPGTRGKSGTFYRLFTREEGIVYLNKAICDMFSLDIDELEEFGFEQGETLVDPVRVSDCYGLVAYLKPAIVTV